LSVYDELSLEDTEALSQVDDGADIVGMNLQFPLKYSTVCQHIHLRLYVHYIPN